MLPFFSHGMMLWLFLMDGICRRNTDETRIVLLKIWQELYRLSPSLFSPQLTGAFCQRDKCLEGKMGCKRKLGAGMEPLEILEADYPALFGEAAHEDKTH